MEKSMQSNLCKGLRACGIPKEKAYEILNVVSKWVDSNGLEWTNKRIKDLRQWYETCLTGKPVPPDWFKHNHEGYPVGIWKWVFNQKPAKALGVLSCNTVFYEDSLSAAQKEKFLKGLSGNQSYATWKEMAASYAWIPPLSGVIHRKLVPFSEMPAIQFPTIFDMNGSIPIQDGQKSVRPKNNLGEALRALQLSWKSCPQVTIDFLDEMDLLGYIPESIVYDSHSAYGGIALMDDQDRRIGRASIIQQPQLKARTVGNPNRVLQKTLDPLKEVFMTTARKLPTDCTHDQESGVNWVQSQLRQGHELAGSDLTSASDLLEISRCLTLVDQMFEFSKISGYKDWERYYYNVCRCPWWCSELNCEVKWEQGTVLGTGPSFGLLTLTNNTAGFISLWKYATCTLEPYRVRGWMEEMSTEYFRVIGDDIIMRSELLPYYQQVIKDLGGEINLSKSLVSDRVAEFAGRVITSDSCFLKAVKYNEPSDNSFMSYVSQLGDQAKFFLKPRQRRVYDALRFIPGIAVDGPWMPDSYGESLSLRYLWYLEEVEPVLKTAEPDLQLQDYSLSLLTAKLDLESSAKPDLVGYDVPIGYMPNTGSDEGYLPSQVTPSFRTNGDPRLTNGKTLLDVLYQHLEKGRIRNYEDWKEDHIRLAHTEQFDIDDEMSPDRDDEEPPRVSKSRER